MGERAGVKGSGFIDKESYSLSIVKYLYVLSLDIILLRGESGARDLFYKINFTCVTNFVGDIFSIKKVVIK